MSAAAYYDTIVIGLGAAGATAASILTRAGFRVLALEAQDRIGGRINTVSFGNGVVELGAEWIHGERPSKLFDLAVKHNVAICKQILTHELYRSDGSVGNGQLLMEILNYSFSLLGTEEVKSGTVGEQITSKLLDYLKQNHPAVTENQDFVTQLLVFLNLIINNYEGSNDWNDVSALTRYEELEGHHHWSWHRYGYKTMFDLLLNIHNNNNVGLPNLDIKLGVDVSNICWLKDLVTITCRDSAIYKAKNVIVTVSLGVLKECHKTLFTPSLPKEKVEAIDLIPFGLIDKIVLSFPEPWWSLRSAFFAFVWKGEDLALVPPEDYWTTRIFGASRSMGASNVLVLWTSGNVAKQVEILPEDTVKRKLIGLLQKFMGAGIVIPEPSCLIRSTWYNNRFTRGSYSFDSPALVARPDARATLREPLRDVRGVPRVLFAGEHVHDTHFSTVHGAMHTGYEAAHTLLPTSRL